MTMYIGRETHIDNFAEPVDGTSIGPAYPWLKLPVECFSGK